MGNRILIDETGRPKMSTRSHPIFNSTKHLIYTEKINTAFTITIDTTKAGSASDTFILPTYGSGYDAYIDWGDGGVIENIAGEPGNVSHQYSESGTYQIKITGIFPTIYFNNSGDKLKLMSIDNWGEIVWNSMGYSFYGCSNMVGNYSDVPNLSSANSTFYMFGDCSLFDQSVSSFDTSSIIDMGYMFFGCSSFNQSVSSFDTSNVINMAYMFYGCSSFNQPVLFDTSKVTNMSFMFAQCFTFNQPLSGLTTSSVTDMRYMFMNCSSLNQSVSSFDTSNVTNMEGIFTFCSSFNQPVSNFNTSKVTSMRYMFGLCTSFNQSVSNFDTSNVTNMQYMFNTCYEFKQSLASFNMTKVTNAEDMCTGGDINVSGTTTNYDATLVAWELQDLVNNLTIGFGTSKYSDIGETARSAIISDDNWTIFDGGHI